MHLTAIVHDDCIDHPSNLERQSHDRFVTRDKRIESKVRVIPTGFYGRLPLRAIADGDVIGIPYHLCGDGNRDAIIDGNLRGIVSENPEFSLP